MKRQTVNRIAIVTVMAAIVCTLTLVVRIPIPATGGYIHLGDVGANFAALAFGPWIGALIAGGGMAIADLIGYPIFAPGTLVVHGLQAIIVGLVGRSHKPWLMFVAAIAGGAVVVAGYFLYEWLILQMGVLKAAQEVPFNAIQALSGAIGVALYMLVLRAYPPLARWTE
jgi:uncharacterized membrane protein